MCARYGLGTALLTSTGGKGQIGWGTTNHSGAAMIAQAIPPGIVGLVGVILERIDFWVNPKMGPIILPQVEALTSLSPCFTFTGKKGPQLFFQKKNFLNVFRLT